MPIKPLSCSVRRHYVPFYRLVIFKYLYFCVRIMDLGIEMYEMCLIQWPGWEREIDVWDEVGPGLADDIIAEIKINSPLHKC